MRDVELTVSLRGGGPISRGVGTITVNRARKSQLSRGGQLEERVGLDGMSRRAGLTAEPIGEARRFTRAGTEYGVAQSRNCIATGFPGELVAPGSAIRGALKRARGDPRRSPAPFGAASI